MLSTTPRDVLGVNGFRGPLPTKLGQNNDGDLIPHQPIDTDDFRLHTAIIAHFFEKHVSEDDGMFTF